MDQIIALESALYDSSTPERRRRELRDEISSLRARIGSSIDVESFLVDDEEES